MKKYTIEDMANFERDECGRLICPSGDYSQIESFGEGCNLDNNLKFENIADSDKNDGQLFEAEISEMSETITAGMEEL